jgi:hypothetical protein
MPAQEGNTKTEFFQPMIQGCLSSQLPISIGEAGNGGKSASVMIVFSTKMGKIGV